MNRQNGLTIEGYASVFGQRDFNDDVVAAGAFTRALTAKGPQGVRMLYQHEPREPIGIWLDAYEDQRGLFVRGRVFEDTPKGRLAGRLVRAGALDGLSIGFRMRGSKRDESGRLRILTDVELWEVSLVTFPMLPSARIVRVDGVPFGRVAEGLPTRAARHF